MSSTETETLATPLGVTMTKGRALKVTVVAGPDKGASHLSDSGRAVVGRAEGVEVRLTDKTVSQFHAELSVQDDGVMITDLGSRNGTRVGEIVLRSGVIPTGGQVTLGSTTLQLEFAGEFESPASAETSFGSLVGGSRPMRDVYAALSRLARTDLSVLIEGDTGTGKELAARALHDHGPRASGPFLTLDCTAIPATLAESILFGHEKGAFTGANERRIGVFEAAHGGTVFLDEVGELTPELQPKLLRVIERREITPVGSTKAKAIDVRVVSATLRDLRSMVNRGAFREDLYYRLAQARVRLPRLEDRREDIRALAQHFLARIPKDVRAARTISNAALDALASRSFPGNVRELSNVIERAALLAEGATISVSDLAFERMISSEKARAKPSESAQDEAPASGEIEPFNPAKKTVISRFEREYLERLLQRTGTNVSRAASLAGVDRHTLRDLLKRHGLRGED